MELMKLGIGIWFGYDITNLVSNLKMLNPYISRCQLNLPQKTEHFRSKCRCRDSYLIPILEKLKSTLHYSRDTTPKRVRRGRVQLRYLAPGKHNFEEKSERWRAVGDTTSNLTGPVIEPQTSRTDRSGRGSLRPVQSLAFFQFLVSPKTVVPKLGVKYPRGVICDSIGGYNVSSLSKIYA